MNDHQGLRVGIGYDSHRLLEGRLLVIGGVTIPFPKGCIAHSDGDVLIHSIIDSALGAAGMGTIGEHFPDSDPKYKDISSIILLRETHRKLSQFDIIHIDTVVITDTPKLSPYFSAMKQTISDVLHLSHQQINIKATTNEGMGFIGRGEGIAAQAVCLLNKRVTPESE